MDCGTIHLFLDRKTYSQYLFIYVPLATCFLKLALKNAHLVNYIVSLEKQKAMSTVIAGKCFQKFCQLTTQVKSHSILKHT